MKEEIAKSESAMKISMREEITKSESAMKISMKEELTRSENLILDEMERTRSILEKQIANIQEDVKELGQYSKELYANNLCHLLVFFSESTTRKSVT